MQSLHRRKGATTVAEGQLDAFGLVDEARTIFEGLIVSEGEPYNAEV